MKEFNESVFIAGSDNYCGESREEYLKRLKKEGREIRVPEDDQLFIDIDTEEQYDKFRVLLDILERENGAVFPVHVVESISGLPHRHITVSLPFTVTPIERIAFQCALGSDRKRELLSLLRVMRGDIYPTLFAEGKGDGDFTGIF